MSGTRESGSTGTPLSTGSGTAAGTSTGMPVSTGTPVSTDPGTPVRSGTGTPVGPDGPGGTGTPGDEGASGGFGGTGGTGTPGDGAAAGGPGGPGGTGAPDDGAAAGEPGGSGAGAAVVSLVRELLLVLGIALGLSLLIKTFLVQAFFIPSPSMESTLIRGDRVLVNKLAPGPIDLRRGDVVVFADPGRWLSPSEQVPQGVVRDSIRSGLTFVGLLPAASDEHLIKRVIGLSGDTVVCCDDSDRLTVNGVAIDEPYVYGQDLASTIEFTVTVPPDHVWVMGDHRSLSRDSRFHQEEKGGGSVPVSDVVGRAFVTVWPFGRAGLLRNPAGTFAEVPAP